MFNKIARNNKKLEKLDMVFEVGEAINSNKLIEKEIAEVNLPSGKIIAADPFSTDQQKPFTRKVKSGKYPVFLYFLKIGEEHNRVAYAKIQFLKEKPDRWILAIPEDADLEELKAMKDGEYIGFPVDAGLGCFLDQKTNEEYTKIMHEFYENNQKGNYYDDVLAEEFKKTSGNEKFSRDLGDWNNHFPNHKKDLNVVMFASGWGDGYYPAYFGLSEKGEIVDLTIDFLLEVEEGE